MEITSLFVCKRILLFFSPWHSFFVRSVPLIFDWVGGGGGGKGGIQVYKCCIATVDSTQDEGYFDLSELFFFLSRSFVFCFVSFTFSGTKWGNEISFRNKIHFHSGCEMCTNARILAGQVVWCIDGWCVQPWKRIGQKYALTLVFGTFAIVCVSSSS